MSNEENPLVDSAVVRIYATTQDPDYDSPWQSRVASSSTGSGVVVADGLVLTGAHVVANGTFLQVQKISDPSKVQAVVAGICHDCDLALLKVSDPSFMEGVLCATIGELPHLRDRVAVAGFPVGGEEVSITEGVVSRIEVQRYSHSQRHLLAVTVDAAINPGNSGGPVFRDGKVVGIAFQKLGNAEGIGEMVPAPIIHHFLESVKKGEKRVKIPALGISTQGIENPFLRKSLALPKEKSGVLVLSIEHGSSASDKLQIGDVITSIDGCPIANNATIQLLDRYRTRYDVMLGWQSIGDTLQLEVWREGKSLNISLPLQEVAQLVPRDQYDNTPRYFIFGGLVFQPLSRDFLSTWDSWWEKAPKEFLHHYYSGSRTKNRREVVVLSQVLAEETNVGYEGFHSESVVEVNGVAPVDMADFVTMLDNAKGLVKISTSAHGIIVLDAETARKANKRILERYRIPSERSLN